jgi:hypothetical protein
MGVFVSHSVLENNAMQGENLDFLDDEHTEEPAEAVEPEQEEQPPEPVEAEATEAEPVDVEETGEQEAVPPAADPEPQVAPITALLDEREKRQEAQRKAQELEARLRQIEARQRQPAAPDLLESPEDWAAYNAQTIQQQQYAQKLSQSRFFAEREYGKETVDEAYAFFDQNPHLTQQFADHPSPFHAAVDFYKKQKFLTDVGDDPEAYINRMVEERLKTAAPVEQSKPKAPPASLSRAPSAGKETITPGNGFDALFPE